MKLESQSSSTTTFNTYRLITESHGPVIYTEMLDDKGKVQDCTMRDEDGKDIDDPALLEEIETFVDELVETQRRDEKNGLYPQHEDPAN